MLAAYAESTSPDDPLSGLRVGERPDPSPRDGWVTVDVRAAALNHHDLWSLRGVGLPDERLPMILGCDGAGVDVDGNEVIVHAVIATEGWTGDETLDPKRTLLSELHPGTLAERVAVPRGNLVPKPPELSFREAACLPVAWLTAYRMLFTRAALKPGQTVLVQGAGGGVATAAVVLGSAAGVIVSGPGAGERVTRGPHVTLLRSAANDLGVAEWTLDGAFEGAGHDGRVDSYYVLEGELDVTIDRTARSAGPDTLVTIPAGVPHALAGTKARVVHFLAGRPVWPPS